VPVYCCLCAAHHSACSSYIVTVVRQPDFIFLLISHFDMYHVPFFRINLPTHFIILILSNPSASIYFISHTPIHKFHCCHLHRPFLRFSTFGSKPTCSTNPKIWTHVTRSSGLPSRALCPFFSDFYVRLFFVTISPLDKSFLISCGRLVLSSRKIFAYIYRQNLRRVLTRRVQFVTRLHDTRSSINNNKTVNSALSSVDVRKQSEIQRQAVSSGRLAC